MNAFRRIILTAIAVVLSLGWLGCLPGEPSKSKPIMPMGMNISGVGYYHSRNLMFNDVMLTKNQIGTASYLQGGYTGELATDGYPAEVVKVNGWDKNAPAILVNDIYEGDYVLLYDGDGEVEIFEGVEVLSSQPGRLEVRLTACVRTPDYDPHRRILIRRSTRGDHVRNMRLIPTKFEGKEDQMPLFSADFLDGLRTMHVLRFMDAQNTNSTLVAHWSERPLVTDWAFNNNGLPLEILIQLANTLKIDPWFCVPHRASDDYITKMAQLIKSQLDPALRCYIEYSNEIWHEGFAQGKWINNPTDAVDSYILTDLAALRSPLYGTDNRHLKNAYFMSRTFRLFAKVFGDERSRIRTVGTYYTWVYPREIIEYLVEQGTPADVMAGVGYFNFTKDEHEEWMKNPDRVTADDIINKMFDIWDKKVVPTHTRFAEIVVEYGMEYVVYEGGQHMQPYQQGNHPYNQAVYDAQIHPKMYDLYIKIFQLHKSYGCTLFANFSYVGLRQSQYGSWGVLENLSDIHSKNLRKTSPKYQAILDANTK